MANTMHDLGIARQIGTYGDAVEVPANARWLMTAGTPGLALDGSVPPDIGGQAELAWSHIVAMLQRAGMSVHDLVKVTQYLLHPADIPAYAQVRTRYLGSARPASLLLIAPGASVPVPTFVPSCSTCVYERRNQRDTSNSMNASVALDLTFLRRTRSNAGRNVKSATLVRPEFLLEIEVCAAKA